MKILLNYSVLFILLVSSMSVFALSVDTVFVINQYHTIDSSRMYLVAEVTVSSSPCSVYDISLVHADSSIHVKLCYIGGLLQTTCSRSDTIDLGIRKNGLTNVLAVFQTYVNDTCKSSSFFTDTFEFNVTTEISDIAYSRQISIHPNPATNQISIQSETNLPQSATFQLFNLTGQMVLQKTLTDKTNQIPLYHLSKGMYLYRLVSPGHQPVSGKLAIE